MGATLDCLPLPYWSSCIRASNSPSGCCNSLTQIVHLSLSTPSGRLSCCSVLGISTVSSIVKLAPACAHRRFWHLLYDLSLPSSAWLANGLYLLRASDMFPLVGRPKFISVPSPVSTNNRPSGLSEGRRTMSQPGRGGQALLVRIVASFPALHRPCNCRANLTLVPGSSFCRPCVVALRSTRSFVSNIPADCCNTDLVKQPELAVLSYLISSRFDFFYISRILESRDRSTTHQ